MVGGRDIVPGPAAARRRRPRISPLRLIAALAGICILLVAAVGAVAWHYSTRLLAPAAVGAPLFDIRVAAVNGHTVTLARTAADAQPGRWGLRYPGGYAQVGRIDRARARTVTRSLRVLRGAGPSPGERAALDGAAFPGDPRTAFGYRYRPVDVQTGLGAMPAWFVPGSSSTWAIFVHGRGGTRRDSLRALPAFHRRGLPGLLVTYRNDRGAPPSPDGFDHFGFTEWRDLAAAARYALRHGARHLVLVAYSYGAEMALRYLELGNGAQRVSGLVLDSPVVDWGPILRRGAARRGVPGWILGALELTARLRAGIDWSDLDQVARAAEVRVPVLIFRGGKDQQVPDSEVEAFAAGLGSNGRLVDFNEAGHADEWNVDPGRYERALRTWLARHHIGR